MPHRKGTIDLESKGDLSVYLFSFRYRSSILLCFSVLAYLQCFLMSLYCLPFYLFLSFSFYLILYQRQHLIVYNVISVFLALYKPKL